MLQKIDGMLVECEQEVSEKELKHYVKYARKKFPNAKWNKLIITFDGDEVVLGYDFINEPFQRIRRITGHYRDWETDRKSTRLNSSHSGESRMPSSA